MANGDNDKTGSTLESQFGNVAAGKVASTGNNGLKSDLLGYVAAYQSSNDKDGFVRDLMKREPDPAIATFVSLVTNDQSDKTGINAEERAYLQRPAVAAQLATGINALATPPAVNTTSPHPHWARKP
jgi:hypothetical protein